MSWLHPSVEARFWAKVDRGDALACWRWLGAFNRPSKKYREKHGAGESRRPVFKINTQTPVVYAHRLSLAITDGIPLWDRTGLEACHRVECGHFWCVNPAHLYWGTPEQNRADRYPYLRMVKMYLPGVER